jgi:hypothetical protein
MPARLTKVSSTQTAVPGFSFTQLDFSPLELVPKMVGGFAWPTPFHRVHSPATFLLVFFE